MAKKPKYFLEYKLDSIFSVHIDPVGRETLSNDLARGEVCLSLEYTLDDGSYSVNAYPDHIKAGELNFFQESENELKVTVSGSYFQSLDPKWEQDLIDTWQSLSELKVYSNRICDSAPNSHYIGGSEGAFEIGTVSLVEK